MKTASEFQLESEETGSIALYKSFARNHMNLLDKSVSDMANSGPVLKKDFDAARQVTAVNHLVEQMTASLDANEVPKEDRMSVVAEAFMKVRQINALGHTLMSEEELTAAPREAWSARSEKWDDIIHYIYDQYAWRIGRGFVRSHLSVSNMPAYEALRNWLRKSENELPESISPKAYNQELSVNPLYAISAIVLQRPSNRSQRKHKTS